MHTTWIPSCVHVCSIYYHNFCYFIYFLLSLLYIYTGLGLHIVRIHVDIMQGMLAVASSIGKGTLFFVAIPLKLNHNNYNSSNSSSPSHDKYGTTRSLTHPGSGLGGGGGEVRTWADSGNPLTPPVIRRECTFLIVDDSQVGPIRVVYTCYSVCL